MQVEQVEKVLGVPRTDLEKLGKFQGLQAITPSHEQLLSSSSLEFRDRPEAEEDESFKQVIPYVAIVHQSDPDPLVFVYKRSGGDEARLDAKFSVGVGGHINPVDSSDDKTMLEAAVERELTEEATFDCNRSLSMKALINDDSDAVGRVHLGVVYVCMVDKPDVISNEGQECGFMRLSQLLAGKRFDRLESWSKLVVKYLESLMVEAA